MSYLDWSTDADDNISIGGINIAEGCLPSNINDAIRELMAQMRSASSATSAANKLLLTDENGKISASLLPSISTDNLADSAITTAKIANGAVTTVKIPDANITTAKLADSAITTAKIADSAITAVKIADGTITSSKLASSVLSGKANVSLDNIDTAGQNKIKSVAPDWTPNWSAGVDIKASVSRNTNYTIQNNGVILLNMFGGNGGSWDIYINNARVSYGIGADYADMPNYIPVKSGDILKWTSGRSDTYPTWLVFYPYL